MTTSVRSTPDAGRVAVLRRRVTIIVALTIGYNLVEGVIALIAGTAADSAALIGFGLDSGVEVLSATAVAWQFTRREPEKYEKPILRVIAIAFFALAAYTIVAGLVYAAVGIFSGSKRGWSRVGHIALGVFFVVVGVVAFANLAAFTISFALFLGVLVGILWIIEGAVSLSTIGHARNRGWTVAFAILSLIAGVMLLFSPLWGALVLWWLLGISAVALGIANAVRGLSMREG